MELLILNCGVPALLVLMAIAFRRRWIVFGWLYEAEQARMRAWRELMIQGLKAQAPPKPDPPLIRAPRLRPLYQPPAEYHGPVCKTCGSAFVWSDDGRCANCGDRDPRGDLAQR